MPIWIRFLPAAMASVVVGYVLALGDLDSIPRGIALGCLVASWIAPLVFTRREVGTHGTVVVGIAAVVSAGQTRIGPFYGLLAGGFLLASLLSMRAARTRRLVQKTPVPRRVLIALPVVALPITIALLMGLPWLATRIERRFSGMFGADNAMQATAFSTNMMLGATRGMFQSDAVVMRIEGVNAEQRLRQVEYLRGAVYDDYDDTRWQTSFAGGERNIVDANYPHNIDNDPSAWRITLSRNAPRGNDMRWFLPANTCDITTKEQRIQIDHFGIARRAMNEEVPQGMTLRLAGNNCAEPPAALLAPTFRDNRLAYRNNAARIIKETLTPIADAWIAKAQATTKREKLKAIERELATGYEYSLAVDRTPRMDPIIDFLTVHKAGHCEYFAAAMVLLARTQGISARLVGGYHTTEFNPITKQVVVRDRNAHTWVEAWIDDESSNPTSAASWHAYDPTPAIESFGRGSSRWANIADLFSSLSERAFIMLRRLGPIGIAIVLASLLASYYAGRAAIRFVRAQLQNRLRRVRRRITGDDGDPLPSFVSLESALKNAGHGRDEFEPLEAFARRLLIPENAALPWAKEVAVVLRAYADLRYGNIGDEADIEKEITRAMRSIARYKKA